MSLFAAVHRVLPVPNFLRLPSVGVDISDTSLKYIQFAPDYQHGELDITCSGDVDIPEGTLARGEFIDREKLTEALRTVAKTIDTQYVRISLPEEKAYIFETEIKAGTSFKEIRGALEFRLEENVPLQPKDAYFDFEVINATHEHAPIRVSVTVYARETINGYYEAARAAGLIPLSFEVEAAAIARASLSVGTTGAHMIIDFGKTRTGIGIVHQGSLMYTSTIDIGGSDLSTAMRTVLGADTEESTLTDLKNTVGLTHSPDHPDLPKTIATSMEGIVSELQLRLQYWQSHAESLLDPEVRSIVLCGGSSNLKGLPAFVEEHLGVPAERAQVWRNAFSLDAYVPAIDQRHSYGYATAIGLALAGHIAFYD